MGVPADKAVGLPVSVHTGQAPPLHGTSQTRTPLGKTVSLPTVQAPAVEAVVAVEVEAVAAGVEEVEPVEAEAVVGHPDQSI